MELVKFDTQAMQNPEIGGVERERYLCRSSTSGHLMTGDIVRAMVRSGKKVGRYVGRVAVRASGSFNIQIKGQRVQGISYRHCIALHKSDGYSYQKGVVVFPPLG
jgi:hypothetical protein